MVEPARLPSDLRLRVLTAVALAGVVLGTLAVGGPWGWPALVVTFASIAVWEGARLVGRGGGAADPAALGLGLAAVFAALALSVLPHLDPHGVVTRLWLALALFYWIVLVPVSLARTRIVTGAPSGALALALVIGATVLSVVLLHQRGALWLVAVLVIAVVADVAGYFVGRRWGRVPLAPRVSPRKTREGALGGIVAASLWVAFAASLAGLTDGVAGLVVALFGGALLGGLSIIGDLWESQLKRQAGVKDSSNLLPGHGGVLDRVDAQLAVLPGATLALLLLGPLP